MERLTATPSSTTRFSSARARLLCASLIILVAGAAVADDPRVLYPRITVINFDPIVGLHGDVRLHDYMGWFDPRTQVDTYLAGMAEASHGLMLERMSQFVDMDFWPVKADGFQYSESQYLAGDWHFPDGVDYVTIAREYNLARKVDRGEIDEVKIFGGPYFGYWESTMAGLGGYWCNSGPQQKIACSKIFIMMGWNYERSVSLHATGHRAESIMTHVYDGWSTTGDRTIWDRFGWNIGQTTISPVYGVGSAHYPPNGDSDYDYGNPQTVTSYAPDWMDNFPDLTGETAQVNRYTWGTPWELNFFKWWYRHMPHVAGRNNHDGYDRLNNWWEYIFNFNEHPESGGDHVLGGTPPEVEPYAAAPHAITSGVNDAWAPVVSATGRVVWYASDGEDFEIYSAECDGSDVVRITDNALIDEAPEINAAGQIVWHAFDGRDYEVFTANADGSGLTQVTNNTVNDWHPDISDSGRIVWDRWDGEDYEVLSAYVDGSDAVQITDNRAAHGKPLDDVWPRINASNRVVWSGYDGANWEIYSANADGTDVVQITNGSYINEFPRISDAGKVVWHAWHNDNNAEVYAADATGGDVARLSENGVWDVWPRVNTRGDVVWMRRWASRWEIVLWEAGAVSATLVTSNDTHDQYPVIDDGGRIAWQGFDGSDWEIYTRVDNAVYQVTDNDFDDRWPQVSGAGHTVWHADSTPTVAGAASNIFAVVDQLVGDIDGDGDVDLSDLAALLGAYRACAGDPDYDPAADLDSSGCVDLADLAALLGSYGSGV